MELCKRTNADKRRRSETWVRTLANGFYNCLSSSRSPARVFSKSGESVFELGPKQLQKSKLEMGRNEMLHDILVCRTREVDSAHRKAKLHFISEVLWQIESELAPNSREALYDFNKLVLGSAQNLLFIGPLCNSKDSQKAKRTDTSYLEVLAPAARCCKGRIFTALISSPYNESWTLGKKSLKLWELSDGEWELVA